MAIIVIFDSWMDLWNLWQERWTTFQDLYQIDPATDIKRICMIRIMQYTLQCNGPAWATALSAECISEKCDIVRWSYRKSPAFKIIFYAFILWELLARCPIDANICSLTRWFSCHYTARSKLFTSAFFMHVKRLVLGLFSAYHSL